MKRVFCISVLSISWLGVFAQDTSASKTDSIKQAKSFIIHDAAVITDDEPLIIIDDRQTGKSSSKHILKKIKPEDILEISILKDASAAALYGSKGANGVIIITTKSYAQQQYQQKLSGFSKSYKNYLKTNKDDDSELLYVLNGEPLNRTANGDLIKKLYDIPLYKIKAVTFMDKYYKDTFNNNKPLILINTKK